MGRRVAARFVSCSRAAHLSLAYPRSGVPWHQRGAIRPASPPIPQGRRNSNSFLAHIARQLPELGIDMPSNAVGKDFLPGSGCFAAAPSRSKFQLSLCRLFGIVLAAREGLEVNLLGLGLGADPVRPALKLPALGRLVMENL